MRGFGPNQKLTTIQQELKYWLTDKHYTVINYTKALSEQYHTDTKLWQLLCNFIDHVKYMEALNISVEEVSTPVNFWYGLS
jgi:hypothetical protein